MLPCAGSIAGLAIACLRETRISGAERHVLRYSPPVFRSKAAVAVLLSLGLLGCAGEGDIFETGILTSYTACPAVAIPAPAGDVTLFNPANSRDSSAIDVVATITNVRSSCDESGE